MTFDEIPLNDLADNDYNPRRRLDDDRIAELAESIQRVGLISPLTVRRIDGKAGLAERLVDDALDLDQPEDPSFEVVAGTRRLHALREIHGKESEHEVACQVVDLPDDEAELLALAENLDRDDLTPTEEAEAFADRVFVRVDKATVDDLEDPVEIRRAGTNYTVPFTDLVDHLDAGGAPQGAPLPFPHRKATATRTVADDIPSRTPVEIARRCRLYALPQDVWPLVDDEELPLRQAEIIAGLAGVEAPWEERVEAMVEAARECVDEAWAKVHCREEVEERRSMLGSSEGGPVEEAVEDVEEVIEEAEELLGREFASVDEARAAVEERLGEVEGEVEELEARAERLDELSERLDVGIEERFRGDGLDGFDSRKTYCSYCGQATTKEDIGEVKRVVEDEKGRIEMRIREWELLETLNKELR